MDDNCALAFAPFYMTEPGNDLTNMASGLSIGRNSRHETLPLFLRREKKKKREDRGEQHNRPPANTNGVRVRGH